MLRSRFASALSILVDASNGASDYGNKFGEPLINGFTRSFGLHIEYVNESKGKGREQVRCVREYVKPIMFSGGIGQLGHLHSKKGTPKAGMKVVKLGGPAYRIGVGGGSASSMIQGANQDHLDYHVCISLFYNVDAPSFHHTSSYRYQKKGSAKGRCRNGAKGKSRHPRLCRTR